jgi:hypothetical protein
MPGQPGDQLSHASHLAGTWVTDATQAAPWGVCCRDIEGADLDSIMWCTSSLRGREKAMEKEKDWGFSGRDGAASVFL